MDQTMRKEISYNVVASLWYREWLPAIERELTRLQISYLAPKQRVEQLLSTICSKFGQRYSSCCKRQRPNSVHTSFFQTTNLFDPIFFGIIKHLLDLTLSNIQFIAPVQNNIGLSFASPPILPCPDAINWMLDSVSSNKCLITRTKQKIYNIRYKVDIIPTSFDF